MQQKNADKVLGGIKEGANIIRKKKQVEEERMNILSFPISERGFCVMFSIDYKMVSAKKCSSLFISSNKNVYKC